MSEGPVGTRIKYIEATGGYRSVSSPRRFVARGEPRGGVVKPVLGALVNKPYHRV